MSVSVQYYCVGELGKGQTHTNVEIEFIQALINFRLCFARIFHE